MHSFDVEAKNVSEYLEFMDKHTGDDKRFVDVKCGLGAKKDSGYTSEAGSVRLCTSPTRLLEQCV